MTFDKIKRLKDIQNSQMPLLTDFFTKMVAKDFVNAKLVITNNNLEKFVINADNINEIINAITNQDPLKASGLEKFILDYMKENVTAYLQELLQAYQKDIDNLIDKGVWNNTTVYNVNNRVYYEVNHTSYYAITDVPNGFPPTNTTYWTPISIGDTISVEPNSNNDYVYSPTFNYPINALVTSQDRSVTYISLKDNNLGNSLNNTAWWNIFVGLGEPLPNGQLDSEQGQGIPIVDVLPPIETAVEGDLVWLIVP